MNIKNITFAGLIRERISVGEFPDCLFRRDNNMKITKNGFLAGFATVTVVLAVVRCIFPSVARDRLDGMQDISNGEGDATLAVGVSRVDTAYVAPGDSLHTDFYDKNGREVKHRVFSVPGFDKTFPDSNAVQLEAAEMFGVRPVANRQDAEARKNELVYVGGNPYYFVNKLDRSIPYLVPRAAILLQDIGRNFMDSLQIKKIPLHKIMVTSVLRSGEDVERLQRYNRNATANSCHLYGTTFDVSYTRFKTVSDPEAESRRQVRNDTLKYVLSEVLRDLRVRGRCYVKYEIHQSCYHITVR